MKPLTNPESDWYQQWLVANESFVSRRNIAIYSYMDGQVPVGDYLMVFKDVPDTLFHWIPDTGYQIPPDTG